MGLLYTLNPIHLNATLRLFNRKAIQIPSHPTLPTRTLIIHRLSSVQVKATVAFWAVGEGCQNYNEAHHRHCSNHKSSNPGIALLQIQTSAALE
jgi:hypothetical protein